MFYGIVWDGKDVKVKQDGLHEISPLREVSRCFDVSGCGAREVGVSILAHYTSDIELARAVGEKFGWIVMVEAMARNDMAWRVDQQMDVEDSDIEAYLERCQPHLESLGISRTPAVVQVQVNTD